MVIIRYGEGEWVNVNRGCCWWLQLTKHSYISIISYTATQGRSLECAEPILPCGLSEHHSLIRRSCLERLIGDLFMLYRWIRGWGMFGVIGCHPSQNSEQRELGTCMFNVHVDFHSFWCRFPDQTWLSIPSSLSSMKSVRSVAEQYKSGCVKNMQKYPQIAFHLNRNRPHMCYPNWQAHLGSLMASSSCLVCICTYSNCRRLLLHVG